MAMDITDRYPPQLYRLVVALNRWVFRVWGYAVLLTDAYPPFRLDLQPQDTPPPQDRPAWGYGPGAS